MFDSLETLRHYSLGTYMRQLDPHRALHLEQPFVWGPWTSNCASYSRRQRPKKSLLPIWIVAVWITLHTIFGKLNFDFIVIFSSGIAWYSHNVRYSNILRIPFYLISFQQMHATTAKLLLLRFGLFFYSTPIRRFLFKYVNRLCDKNKFWHRTTRMAILLRMFRPNEWMRSRGDSV